METNKTMDLLPLSKKHKDYIIKSLSNRINVAEGAIRAGKTIDNCIIFALNLMMSKDKIHLATGSTLPNAKLNIGECNGFGLEHIFKGHCRWGKYKDNDALFIELNEIIPNQDEKIVIFAGGGKSDSYKKILGNSYGIWIATEINEHYDSDDSKESFIKVAMGRQLASRNPKIVWDLNPSNPNAQIYTDYIDLWEKNGIGGGYNYEHFTIYDNTSITEERKKEIISQYDINSIWYLRDILGKRVVCEGLIYQEFQKYHIISMQDWLLKDARKELSFIVVGVDFGGSVSAHSFVATGYTKNFKNVFALKQKRIPQRIDDIVLTKEFIDFINELIDEYKGIPIYEIRCDSAEQTLIAGFQKALIDNHIGIPIKNAIKGLIMDRIRLECKLFSTNKLYILECCNPLINALQTAIWEKNKIDTRLDDGIQDIDSLDSFEYTLEPYKNYLVRL